jgi:hypothetical protein
VRVVFDNMYNRRRVHSYAVVLQEAKRQKVTPAMLAEWIRLYGGIEEIRLNAKPSHQAIKVSKERTKLSKKQRDQQKEAEQERFRVCLQSFDRLVESGVFCVGDSIQADTTQPSEHTNFELNPLVHDSASKDSSDDSAESTSDARSESSCQKVDRADARTEESTELQVSNSPEGEMLVCIAYRLADGTYEVKWELQADDVRSLAIAAYRMEKHGVYSEYDQVRSAMQAAAAVSVAH